MFGRKKPLSPKYRVGDRNSVSTRLEATREAVAMEFGQYHRGLVLKRRSASFWPRLGRFAGKRRDISSPRLLFRAVLLKQVLLQVFRGLFAVLDQVVVGADRVRHGGSFLAFFSSGVPIVDDAGAQVSFRTSFFFPRTSFCDARYELSGWKDSRISAFSAT